jgi:hypothetical protein
MLCQEEVKGKMCNKNCDKACIDLTLGKKMVEILPNKTSP